LDFHREELTENKKTATHPVGWKLGTVQIQH